MKLLIAIVQDKDAHLLGDEFAQANIRATRLSTTGGFLTRRKHYFHHRD